MPQMSPLNWLFLLFYFIVIIIFTFSFIYFVYLSKFNLSVTSKPMNYMIWMW